MSMRSVFVLFCCLSGLHAQIAPPAPAATTPTTLADMEKIYQRELSTRHIPLISRYLIELQRRAALATAEQRPAWLTEITRVQQLIRSGGVIDLTTARAAVDNSAMPMPMPTLPPPPREASQAVITLAPTLATPPPVITGDAAAIGELEWRIEFIAAGSYDVHIHYACPAITATMPLRVEFAGVTLEAKIDSTLLTADDKTFRVLKLGKLTFPADVRARSLRFTADDKNSTVLRLRQLYLTPAKPASSSP